VLLLSWTLLMPILVHATQSPAQLPPHLWDVNLNPEGPNCPLVPPGFPQRDLGNYIGQLQLTAAFLDSMQEHDPESVNFGGLHEGEGQQLWLLVESDNTQEAIRVWCEYARFFDDPQTYRQNIDDAWTYLSRFPAWEESHPDSMYAMHNSGWGLVAEMGFRALYDDSQRDYGLSCAQHLIDHVPRILPNNADPLMPLVAGWSAGTLYLYGLLEDNQGFQDRALVIASQVKDWIDTNPERLNNNERWALCGGTAMWGVLKSLGHADSAATAQWARERLQRMDILAGVGWWNNSWNIWYAHAWLAAYDLIGDAQCRANAVFIVDSLLVQDHDGDGGIPATIGEGSDLDQSWVSAYTAWMGLINLFELVPQVDVRLLSLLAPSLTRPYPVGTPLTLAFRLVNQGLRENVSGSINIGDPVVQRQDIQLSGWQPQDVIFDNRWTPQQTGNFTVTTLVETENDGDPSNDTLSFELCILPVGLVDFQIHNADNSPIGGSFYFYNLDLNPDTVFAEVRVEAETGAAQADLMVGSYRVLIVPDFPYAQRTIDRFQLTEGGQEVHLVFHHPVVLLVDNDNDSTRAKYFTRSLESLGYSYFRWNRRQRGAIDAEAQGFETVIYYTGNRRTETIPAEDRAELAACSENVVNLFITGQSIATDLKEDDFLSEVCHVRQISDLVTQGMVVGIPGDEVLDNRYMLLVGSAGANNQSRKSGVTAAEGGIVCALYEERGDTAAAVRWEEESGAKGMFFAFGFEGISGIQSDSRDDIMQAIMSWMGTTQEVQQDLCLPIATPLLDAWPNPSNSGVRFSLPILANGQGQVVLFDILGRQVVQVEALGSGQTWWNGFNAAGQPVASGVYRAVSIDPRTGQSQGAVSVVIIR